jgi:hypothetical protein
MTIAKEVVYALHQRLKELAVDATPDKIAYLAKALESIAGQSTVLDIVQMTDEKLKELLNAATKHLKDLSDNKTSSLSTITTAKTESVDEINTLKTNSLKALKTSSDSHISLLDTRKDEHIAAINTAGDLDSIRNRVDVPAGSSVMKEVKNRNMIEPGALPFLFGILSRYNDHAWSNDHGHFTTELGKWYNEGADRMLQLLSGSNAYNHQYSSFYRPPQLYFLQGSNGKFIYREMFTRRDNHSNQYQYPYALLGVIFVKNTTNTDISRTLNFGGSARWSSQYEGAGLFIGTPNNTNADKVEISTITWASIYSHSTNSEGFNHSVNVTVPASKTVAVLFYTSAYYYAGDYSYRTYFMRWSIYNFRSSFLTKGLEVDVKRTLRAWQCPGLEHTHQIWQ